MQIHETTSIVGDAQEEAWLVYSNAIATMNLKALQRHMMERDEFAEVCEDPRVLKIRLFAEDFTLIGMTAVTTDLGAVSLIEPGYFAENWPEHYSRRAIWYVEFMVSAVRGAHVFRELVLTLYRKVVATNGLAAMDFCDYNVAEQYLPQATYGVLEEANRFTRGARVDAQGYYVWRFDGLPVLGQEHELERTHSAGGRMRFGMELVLDLPECDLATISDPEQLALFAKQLVEEIGMEAHGDPQIVHFGEPGTNTLGYTLVQLIKTSSITAHFSEQDRTAHINVFSCRQFDADRAARFIRAFFRAGQPIQTILMR